MILMAVITLLEGTKNNGGVSRKTPPSGNSQARYNLHKIP
jgi:hypothetical protein